MRKVSFLLCLIILISLMTACGSDVENLPEESSSSEDEVYSSEAPIVRPDKLIFVIDDLQATYDINQTIQAKVEAIPAVDDLGQLTYQSSNPQVATFSDGVILTLSEGETQLSVTTEDGEITSNTITIQVEDVQKKEEQALLQAEAKEAEEAINQIQDVTLNSGGQITQARTIYNRLSDDAKAYIPNLDVLESAEKRFATLQEEQAQQEAEAAANQIPANVPEENIDPPPVQEPVEEPVEDIQGGYLSIVYWTPNGKSYHSTRECRSLARSKIIKSGTKEDAAHAGKYDPCNNCIR